MRPNLLVAPIIAGFIVVGAAAPASAQAPGMTAAPQYPPPGVPAPPAYGQPAPWNPQPEPLPPPPQPPTSALAPNGEYVAPLSQTTQSTYIPQSVALSGPRYISDWEPGQPIPPGYHAETRVRKGPIISGSVLFGATYLCSTFVAAVGEDVGNANNSSNRVAALYIPVFGPFAEMTQTGSATANFFLALDGAAQAVGIALFIYGMTSPRALLVRNDLAFVTVSPLKLGRDGTGFGLVGRF